MKECPHCGDDEGYIQYSHAKGLVIYMTNFPDKEPNYYHYNKKTNNHCNEQMYDNLSYKDLQYAKCISCGKKIKLVDISK